jgi:hypothetical protein
MVNKSACFGKELFKLLDIFPPTRSSRVPAIQPESVSQTDEATDPEPDTDDQEPVAVPTAGARATQ